MGFDECLKAAGRSVSHEVEGVQPRKQVHQQHGVRGASRMSFRLKEVRCGVRHWWVRREPHHKWLPVVYAERAYQAGQSLTARCK